MAIYALGPSFTATNTLDDTTKTYQPYYDTGTGEVYYTAVPSMGVDLAGTSPEIRGFNLHDIVFQACDGTTQITATAILNDPWAQVELYPNAPACSYVPPAETCDLIINSIVKTDETGVGLNDGTLTVNASTTHSPLQYSLDNVTYQSSNYFTGLVPNNYNIYVKDAFADCKRQLSFTIIPYAAPIQNFTDDLPVITVGPNVSRWNAAFNPIYITYQRTDFGVVSVLSQNANQVKVTLDVALSGEQVGQILNGNSFVKTGLYEIYKTAVSHSYVGGVSVVVYDQLYIGDGGSGFININLYKPGYRIETQLIFGSNAYDRKKITAQHSADFKGQTSADISGFLRTQLNTKDNYNYTSASYKDANLGQSYTVRFRETWSGFQGEWYDGPYPLYFTYAAMQLGERYGGNMLEYVTFPTILKAKFLTNWQKPMMWGGLPFEMSFIYSENVINELLYLELTPDCGEPTNSFLINSDAGYILDADGGRFIISSEYVEDATAIQVVQALGVTRVLIPDIFDCCARSILARLYYLNGETKVYVTEDKYINYQCKCDNDPYVYIKWINSRGAWDYYKFGFNQFTNASISNDDSVVRFVDNWEISDTIEDIISKSSIQQLRVGANNLSEDAAKTLQWARKSIKAMMLVNTNPVKWRTVVIKDGDTDIIQTRKPNSSSVTMTLLLPRDNLQAQ